MLQATSSDSSPEASCQQIKKCIEIALNCVEDNKEKRPNIGDIVNMLGETATNSDARQILSQISSLDM